jgi:DNA replication protein DnaC
MHKEQVIAQLYEMHLSGMADAFERRMEAGEARSVSPEEFFSLLVEDEYNERKNRKLTRLIGRANFKPEQACVENLDYAPSRSLNKAEVLKFTSDSWIKNAETIIITGPTGCGKTYLAEALGLQACKLGYSTQKIRYPLLFEELRSAKGTGTYLRFLNKISKISVLILDDFLMSPINNDEIQSLLEIIEQRSQNNALIITTQYPIDKWYSQLSDPTLADALCDRLVHNAYKFNLKGESMRKKLKKSASK